MPCLIITVIHIDNIFGICELIISFVIFYTVTLLQVKYPLKNQPSTTQNLSWKSFTSTIRIVQVIINAVRKHMLNLFNLSYFTYYQSEFVNFIFNLNFT